MAFRFSYGARGTTAAVIALAVLFVARANADCTVTNLGFAPLPDLGLALYKNVAGGLYPNGANNRPPRHLEAGIQIAEEQVLPRNASGNVDTNSGRIVLLSIGMSNTTGEWGGGFMPLANADPSKNPQLVLVDGAQGGQAATDWTNYTSMTWTNVETRLRNAGVTTNQVQVIWMKHARRNPTQPFPLHAQLLQTNLEEILRIAQKRYPNLKMAYLSSRTRSYATNVGGLNPEPFAYESGFAVRWLIEQQLNGNVNYDSTRGPVVAPWLSWGPYLWADGTNPRSDGFRWLCADLQGDFTHPSPTGVSKVASELLAFFKTDPTAVPWFLRKSVRGQAPTCAPSATVTNGIIPMTVRFDADASDADGSIRDYQWTFDDGTFSTNANPVKTFFMPGTYTARITVTDNDGDTARGSVVVTVDAAKLLLPIIRSNRFEFFVQGGENINQVVEVSTDFVSWVSLQTNRGPFIYSEGGISNSETRVFRSRMVP